MTGVALPQPRTQSVLSGQLTAWPGPGDPLALLMQTLPTPGLLPPAVPTSLCAPCPQLWHSRTWRLVAACSAGGPALLWQPGTRLNPPSPPVRSDPQLWVLALSPGAAFRMLSTSLYFFLCHKFVILHIELPLFKLLWVFCPLIKPRPIPTLSVSLLLDNPDILVLVCLLTLHLSYQHANYHMRDTSWDHIQPGCRCVCKAFKPKAINMRWGRDCCFPLLYVVKIIFDNLIYRSFINQNICQA